MTFGIDAVDDRNIMRILQVIAPLQKRHFVVMEVRGSLLHEHRLERLSKWANKDFRKIAVIVVGDPPDAFAQRGKELILRDKQAALDLKAQTEKRIQDKKREIL